MNNSDVQAFSEVVKQGSFSKAAEKLFITQSTLSSKIKNLEEELECKLFYRKKGVRYVELTKGGKDFLALVDRWNKLYQDMSNLKSSTSSTSFTISALNSISTTILPKVFLEFLKDNTNVFLKTEDLSSYASYEAVGNHSINFAIIVDRIYSLNVVCKPLFSEKLVLISGTSLPLQKNISFENLDVSKFIYCPWFLEFEQWCQIQFGKNFKPFIQIQIVHQLAYVLANTTCWSIVPMSVAKLISQLTNINFYTVNFEIPDRRVFYLHSIDCKDEYILINQLLIELKKELLKLEKNDIVICEL